MLIGKDDNPLRLSDHKPRYQIAQLSKFDAPRCLFSPHEADLPRNRPLIKMPDRQRRIGGYALCNVEFEDSCLNFHKSKRPVKTASSEQVRQPMYKTGLDYWKNYRNNLDILINHFPDYDK